MIKRLIGFLIILIAILPAKGNDLIDTSDPTQLFTFGARIGFNASNRTFPKGHFSMWNNNNWGMGFNAGIVANLNIKEYLSIQPGVFFDSHSGKYAYVTEYINYFDEDDVHYEFGHWRGYKFTIPVMGIVKLNGTKDFKTTIEFGPYFQLSLKQTGQNNVNVLYRLPHATSYSSYIAKLRKYDVGLKMGAGWEFRQKYYFGVHYLAGLCNAWENPSGGKNKEWTFTIGYNF